MPKICKIRYLKISDNIDYSYFMAVWSIVKRVAPRCYGRPYALRPRAIVQLVVHSTKGLLLFNLCYVLRLTEAYKNTLRTIKDILMVIF